MYVTFSHKKLFTRRELVAKRDQTPLPISIMYKYLYMTNKFKFAAIRKAKRHVNPHFIIELFLSLLEGD